MKAHKFSNDSTFTNLNEKLIYNDMNANANFPVIPKDDYHIQEWSKVHFHQTSPNKEYHTRYNNDVHISPSLYDNSSKNINMFNDGWNKNDNINGVDKSTAYDNVYNVPMQSFSINHHNTFRTFLPQPETSKSSLHFRNIIQTDDTELYMGVSHKIKFKF